MPKTKAIVDPKIEVLPPEPKKVGPKKEFVFTFDPEGHGKLVLHFSAADREGAISQWHDFMNVVFKKLVAEKGYPEYILDDPFEKKSRSMSKS